MILTVALLAVIGLIFLLVSRGQTTSEPVNNQYSTQEDTGAEVVQRVTSETPRGEQETDINGTEQDTVEGVVEIVANEEKIEKNLSKVKSFLHLTEFEEIATTETTYYMDQLLLNKSKLFNLDGTSVKLEVLDFISNDPAYEHKLYNKNKTDYWVVNDWAKIKVNDDKVNIFPDEEMVRIELTNGDIVYVAVVQVSGDEVRVFIANGLK